RSHCALGCSPPPCGEGLGVGVVVMRPRSCVTARPHPARFARHPPHKGEGRTEFAARANSISPEYALMRQATRHAAAVTKNLLASSFDTAASGAERRPRQKNAVALFEPRLVKDISLVGEYEILPGDEDDGGLARVGRVGRGGAEVLIAFDAPTPMGDALFDRQHRPGAVGPTAMPTRRREDWTASCRRNRSARDGV